mgnify:CR=1 FL=1
MSLFQRRHFIKIAEIAVALELDNNQINRLVIELHNTNPNFSASRFRNYVEERLWKMKSASIVTGGMVIVTTMTQLRVYVG